MNSLLNEQFPVALIDMPTPRTDDLEPIEIEYDNESILSAFAPANAWRERWRYNRDGRIRQLEGEYQLTNDSSLIPRFISHLQEHITRIRFCDEKGTNRIAVALEEALLNGLYHGNLELSSILREDGSDAFRFMAEQRRRLPPYCDRRLHVQARISLWEAAFVIRDEGPGFDVSGLPDPTDPENLEKASGRGLLLIRAYMDEVFHNAQGNEITMIKRS